MAKKQPVIRSVEFTERDLAGFLDMLRYDNCTVVDWTRGTSLHRGESSFIVRLRSNPDRTPGFEFTTDRWSSFGLTLREVFA